MGRSSCQSVTAVLLSIIGLFVLSCGVKDKPIGSGQPNILSGDLPKGVVSINGNRVAPISGNFALVPE